LVSENQLAETSREFSEGGMMKKSHRALAGISAVVIAVGVSTTAYAAVQIYEMSSGSGTRFMPEPGSSFNQSTSVALPIPKVGDVIGSLWIPRLKRTIDIIQGTDAKQLKIGVGHYVGSVLPGVSDNSVLAGHRDSVFRNLGDVKLGDLITVRTDYGRFVYEVHKIRIVNSDDKTVIIPTEDAVLTLSTCYPFRFIGNAPKRYIVQAGLIIGGPIA
jgi:sortase A